jgi:aryl carrier-like protein
MLEHGYRTCAQCYQAKRREKFVFKRGQRPVCKTCVASLKVKSFTERTCEKCGQTKSAAEHFRVLSSGERSRFCIPCQDLVQSNKVDFTKRETLAPPESPLTFALNQLDHQTQLLATQAEQLKVAQALLDEGLDSSLDGTVIRLHQLLNAKSHEVLLYKAEVYRLREQLESLRRSFKAQKQPSAT